jgi:hypothetical protein
MVEINGKLAVEYLACLDELDRLPRKLADNFIDRLEPEFNESGDLLGWYDPLSDEFLVAG